MLKKTMFCIIMASVLALGSFFSGPLGAQLFEPPPSLKSVAVPEPPNLDSYIKDRAAAIRLGKSLFWDMQVGSDGIQACASCHYHAGADNRFKNELSPGLLAGDNTFQLGGANYRLGPQDFPFHKLEDVDDSDSAVIHDYNDVVSSQGIFFTLFNGIDPCNWRDFGTPQNDPVFNLNGVTTRRVPPRNAPTNINAIFNFSSFQDGRAHNVFNGENPFGPFDPNAGIWVDTAGTMAKVPLRLLNSSLASQAVGPPLSDFEMSFVGRRFVELGRKMLNSTPLAKQFVRPDDSVLGSISAAQFDPQAKGLATNYSDMIKAAFWPQFWDNTTTSLSFPLASAVLHKAERSDPRTFVLNSGQATMSTQTGKGTISVAAPLGPGEFTQMEANFSFFFGLAIQMYESTLVSDDAPYDRFIEGDANALTAEQVEGLDIFLNEGGCINCHHGAEFTGATVNAILGLEPDPVLDFFAFIDGDQVVPPVATAGTGILDLRYSETMGLFAFELSTTNLADTQVADIHIGAPGVTGPAFFTLHNVFEDGPFIPPVLGVLSEADFTPAPANGLNTFADAVAVVKAGNAYIDIHTVSNSGGEIRGWVQQEQPAFEHPVEFMLVAQDAALYDSGFYNIGVRPTADDIGRGGLSPFINPLTGQRYPLSFSRLALLKRDGLLPAELATFVADLPPVTPSPPDRVAVDGAIKTPGLRNIELTGPYFHNGGAGTLLQVVEFYTRGGDFADENIANLDRDIREISHLRGNPQRKQALVEFLKSLTDERVRWKMAPFDHPQLFIPNGIVGDHTTTPEDCNSFDELGFALCENIKEIPAVGAAGLGAQGLRPITAFLPTGCPPGDLNGDCTVDLLDLEILAIHWMQSVD